MVFIILALFVSACLYLPVTRTEAIRPLTHRTVTRTRATHHDIEASLTRRPPQRPTPAYRAQERV